MNAAVNSRKHIVNGKARSRATENLHPLLQTMALGGGCHGVGHKNCAWNTSGVITALHNDNRMAGPMQFPVNTPFGNCHYPQSSMPSPMQMQQTHHQIPQMWQPVQQYMQYQQHPVRKYQQHPVGSNSSSRSGGTSGSQHSSTNDSRRHSTNDSRRRSTNPIAMLPPASPPPSSYSKVKHKCHLLHVGAQPSGAITLPEPTQGETVQGDPVQGPVQMEPEGGRV